MYYNHPIESNRQRGTALGREVARAVRTAAIVDWVRGLSRR